MSIFDAPVIDFRRPPFQARAHAVEEGRTAYRAGQPRSCCPPFVVPEWCDDWRQGWDKAHAERVRRHARQFLGRLEGIALVRADRMIREAGPGQFPETKPRRRRK